MQRRIFSREFEFEAVKLAPDALLFVFVSLAGSEGYGVDIVVIVVGRGGQCFVCRLSRLLTANPEANLSKGAGLGDRVFALYLADMS